MDRSRAIVIVAVLAASAGCASDRAARIDTVPSASVRTDPGLPRDGVGEWRGTVSGREMATALHNEAAGARLTLEPDGTFTFEQNGGQGAVIRSTGRAASRGDTLVLDGRITSPPRTQGSR